MQFLSGQRTQLGRLSILQAQRIMDAIQNVAPKDTYYAERIWMRGARKSGLEPDSVDARTKGPISARQAPFGDSTFQKGVVVIHQLNDAPRQRSERLVCAKREN